ncbi:TetR/AcrR family transcriptional regulator [Gordonia sp. LSe1-13]|uniref:TetR/AcrR family transcriptional regulator n=1 Tax=Gordonia sesuvii TaxID=3116777 RepID=A0ABU7MIF8_9ACTN|nr:TetR/AcrR family transcriptional regulator [Gordonia sp. LSe1-13]
MTSSRHTRRLSATDWVDAALILVTSEGAQAVTIARLCTTLNVTKGSFYWHFTDLDALRKAMAVRWQGMNRARVADLEGLSELPPDDRLAALSTTLISDDHLAVERAIRGWARSNDSIAHTVRSIDEEIFDAVGAALRELQMSPREARVLAGLLVYAGIGYIHGHEGLPAISAQDVQHTLPGLLSFTVGRPQSKDAP